MQETWVKFLGQDDLPGEGNGHFRILAWKIPRTEKPGVLQSTGRKESDTAEHTRAACGFTPKP